LIASSCRESQHKFGGNFPKDDIALLQNHDARTARQQWMRLLACAPVEFLESWADARATPTFVWLKNPETGLVMVRGRVGGTGNRFNLGEITVTRCALRISGGTPDSTLGVAYVQGRSHRKAELAALADALLQNPEARPEVERDLIFPLREQADEKARKQQRKAQATRVEFFTLARGED
jgi:alpha-D-ribose 1-methylphosphonate 5-triphosphate synthase subunit PhnG